MGLRTVTLLQRFSQPIYKLGRRTCGDHLVQVSRANQEEQACKLPLKFTSHGSPAQTGPSEVHVINLLVLNVSPLIVLPDG